MADDWKIIGIGSSSGTSGGTLTGVPNVTSPSLTTSIVRIDGARTGSSIQFTLGCNAPNPIGSGDATFKGFEAWLDNGERRYSVGKTDLFVGNPGDPIVFVCSDTMPNADEKGIKIWFVSYGSKYENEITGTTPSVTFDILVSAMPPSGAVIPVVTNLAAGVAVQTTIQAGGRAAGDYAVAPISYSAPNPLGNGDATFNGVKYFADNGQNTEQCGRGVYGFTGNPGDGHTDQVALPRDFGWPNPALNVDVYALSQSVGYSNTLVKKGLTGETPHVTLQIGVAPATTSPSPISPLFKAGTEDSSGNWTAVMTWDELGTRMLVDGLLVLPLNLNGFGGIAVWITSGLPSPEPASDFYTPTDFTLAADGLTMFKRFQMSFYGVGTSPTSWTFRAVSYDTSTPPQPNEDGSGNLVGPTVVLSTLAPKTAGTLGNEIFNAGVKAVAFVASAPTLPDPRYPAGALVVDGSVTPFVLKRVNAAGTGLELMVNGGADIQAGTITADKIVANSITAAQLSVAYASLAFVQANYITATQIAANYATFNFVNAMSISASRISGGVITASIQINSPIIVGGAISIVSGTIHISIDGSNYVKVQDTSQTALVQITGASVLVQSNAANVSIVPGGLSVFSIGVNPGVDVLPDHISVRGNAGITTTVGYNKSGGGTGTLTFTGGVLTGSV